MQSVALPRDRSRSKTEKKILALTLWVSGTVDDIFKQKHPKKADLNGFPWTPPVTAITKPNQTKNICNIKM